jgi:hypothetical protein
MLFYIQFAVQAWVAQTVESRVVGLVVQGFDFLEGTEVGQMVAPRSEGHVKG